MYDKYDRYVVKSGDSIDSIASKYGTTPQNIMEINNIPYQDMIRVNTELIVPVNKEEYFTVYTINQGDNLYQIAKKYNINPTLLAAINGLNENDYIYPKQEILIPKSGYSYYIVNDGDTLKMVAEKFGVEQNAMLDLNTIYLLPGQLLVNKKQ